MSVWGAEPNQHCQMPSIPPIKATMKYLVRTKGELVDAKGSQWGVEDWGDLGVTVSNSV